MREILFRGKRLDNGEWEDGFYVRMHDSKGRVAHRIHSGYTDNIYGNFYSDDLSPEGVEVDPDTVGQFTGLYDKNGKKIFEGDIVNILGNQEVDDWKDINYNALIAYLDGGFCAIDGTIENHGFRRYALARMDFDLEVIGNIHDNPEFLEGEG